MSQDASPASSPPAPQQHSNASASTGGSKSFIGHAKLIGLFTLGSRVLGLVREMIMGHYLGTGLIASAFTVAFTIPNLFRKLFGEGALSASFIPLYSQAARQPFTETSPDNPQSAIRNPQSDAHDFAAATLNLLIIILAAITLVGEGVIFAILHFADLRPDHVLMLRLTAIMLPYVVLICGTALLSGILQVHKRFAAPAAAPILLNAMHIAVVVLGAWILALNPRGADADIAARQQALTYWLAMFVLVAGVLQIMLLWPGLRAVGFRVRLGVPMRTPLVRKMVRLTIPVAIGAGVLQLSVLLDKAISTLLMQGVDASGNLITHFNFFGHSIAYPLQAGAPARLNLAQFLYQFPLGVFAIALATALFPSLSSDALDADREKFRGVLRDGVEATLWEGLPASLGLILVAEPAVRLLFQHGQVTAHDATLITKSAVIYSAGIWAFSLLQIINRGYYAIHDTVTPLVMSVVNLVLNVAIELPLLWTMGEAGMAVGTLASFSLQAVIMLWMLDRRVGGMGLRQVRTPFMKIVIATALMAAACLAVKWSPLYPRGETRGVWLGQLLLVMGVGAAVYLTASHLLGLDTVRHLLPRRRRRA